MPCFLLPVSLVGSGCTQFAPSSTMVEASPASVRAASPEQTPAHALEAGAPIRRVNGEAVEPNQEAPVLPIGIDTVFRLAEEKNPQVAVARARVQEAFAGKELADTKWLPDLYAGPSYYRHEGGIQNEDGTLTHSSAGAMFAGFELCGKLDLKDFAYQKINAERQVWQHEGELSKVTSETLLDASGTYIDLLTARTGEAIAREQEKSIDSLLDRAEKLASAEPGARVEVARIRAELVGRKQSILKVRQQAGAASAKLIYLLGLDPASQLEPIDKRVVAFDLVDATPSTNELVARALAAGPGVREMEGLLSLIQDSLEKANGPAKYIPVLEMHMVEGGFGAGPGDSMTWDNRWDLGLHVRWNLTDCFTRRQQMHLAETKAEQAHLAYDELRGKLTLGVHEAREAIHSGKAQIELAESQIENARRSYDLSNERLENNVAGSSSSEVLLSLQSLGMAQLNYLNAVRDYDKAQVRLMVLLGPGAAKGAVTGTECDKK